jgi:hypothetical protein
MDLFDYCETLLTTYCGLYSGDKQMVVIQNIICVINYLIEYLEPEVYTIYNDIEKNAMKRKESHKFFKSVKSVMAFSAYYTSLIDIANNCKFLMLKTRRSPL